MVTMVTLVKVTIVEVMVTILEVNMVEIMESLIFWGKH